MTEISKQESRRLHLDWFNQCRTCAFWGGNRLNLKPGNCGNEKSDLFNNETWSSGHCKKWDSFDVETALDIMQEDENRFKAK